MTAGYLGGTVYSISAKPLSCDFRCLRRRASPFIMPASAKPMRDAIGLALVLAALFGGAGLTIRLCLEVQY